jgi:CheY-like chemotaxis protein
LVTDRPRALVVDDVDGVREAVRLMLDTLGYEAQAAAGGAEALDRLAQASYAVVISDLVMPGVSGWMVAEYLRRRRPDIPFVLMTGQPTREVTHRARQLGLSLLEKPFSLEALQAALEEAKPGEVAS